MNVTYWELESIYHDGLIKSKQIIQRYLIKQRELPKNINALLI